MAITTNWAVIAAICGNFWQESTVNPGIWEGLVVGNPGYGLGQWTDNAQVSRRTALFNYLNSKGYALDSGEGQLEFLVYENVWNVLGADGSTSIYSTLTDFLNTTSTDVASLTREWMYHWEGISDGTENVRITFAEECYYQIFMNDDGTRYPWASGNVYLTRNEAFQNALLIKDYFLNENPPEPPGPPDPPDPPGPTPTRNKRKGLPPWLIYQIS